MSIKIGSAPDSWGVWFADDPRQPPWHRFLDEVAAAGYNWIELGPYGYLPPDLPLLRAELGRRGLQTAGSTVMGALEDPAAWPALEREVLGAAELLAGLGARYLVLIDAAHTDIFTNQPLAPPDLDEAGWRRLIDATHHVADLVWDRFGLELLFHPHAETHVEHEEQIERFLRDTDPARVSLCFDTGHHAYRGGDPIAFIRRHHQRIPYLHLKSVDREVQKRVEAEHLSFATAVAQDVFCEPSQGAVDFLALRDLLRTIGYQGWGIVEQDMYPAPLDKPLPIARRTRAYLREIGFDSL